MKTVSARLLFVLPLLLAPALLAHSKPAGKRPGAPTWQLSEAPAVQLGVRDKFGDLGGYQAQFTVTGPDKKRHQKSIQVKGDSWGMVNYPDDFDAYWVDGT